MPKSRVRGLEKAALFAAKLFVSGACFWYVLRQVDFADVLRTLPMIDFRWAAFAVLIVMLQIPLVGLRWCYVLDALALRPETMTRTAAIAVTAIGAFFSQVLPNVAGEGIRVWLLTRFGCGWKNAMTSVLIDRGVGIGLLIAFAFGILLLPSALTALGGYREVVLGVYGAALLLGALGLVFMPHFVPLLERWRYSRWIATFATAVRRVIIGPWSVAIIGIGCLVHALTIVAIWSIARAQGLELPVLEAAVLFTVMLGIMLVPISVGGWGLRELAVVSLLGNHGVAPERALLFSVCFGLVLVAGALPGAVVWLMYRIPRPGGDMVTGPAAP